MADGNLFDIPLENIPSERELFQDLFKSGNLRIERIVSRGHRSPEDRWYDQDEDEWVALLTGEAEILFDDGRSEKLYAGDYLFIPAHKQHKVIYTSEDPPAVWLAIFINLQKP